MSEILSQNQIDQLLSAGGFGSEALGPSGDLSGQPDRDPYPTLEKSIELYCKQASAVLGTIMNKKVALACEACGKADLDTLKAALKEEHLCVALPFKTGFTGEMYLFVNNNDAAIMGDLMMMGEGNAAYTPEHNDALTEMSNQVMSSFTLALTSEIGTQVSSSPSSIAPHSLVSPPQPPEKLDMAIIKVSIEGKDDSTCALLIPGNLTTQFVAKNPASGADVSAGSDMDGGFNVGQELSSQFQQGGSGMSEGFSSSHSKSIEMLLDVDLDVNIELGQTVLTIKRILELAPGSIVELNRMAGEPVDLMVNNKVIAKGEVVVIDESFGIRILSLVSPEDRIKSLR
jgi:flagellar motor switch protein FliN/FliY